MKTVFLHGLGQNVEDWKATIEQAASVTDADCPDLFAAQMSEKITYAQVLERLERQFADSEEPFRICGVSLGAVLALDYTIRHGNHVAALVLAACQYQMPTALLKFQNLLFRCMPGRAFESTGLSKNAMIHLANSMSTLDFRHQIDSVTCPVMIVCGEKDTANLKASRELEALLPHARLHTVPGSGHEVNKDAPQSLARLLDLQWEELG
ncbi:MAG: alpha/beta hydrolase [Clostridiales bacterium]|nr:alpha/beta hydrolase [Clostridiales bacterium]